MYNIQLDTLDFGLLKTTNSNNIGASCRGFVYLLHFAWTFLLSPQLNLYCILFVSDKGDEKDFLFFIYDVREYAATQSPLYSFWRRIDVNGLKTFICIFFPPIHTKSMSLINMVCRFRALKAELHIYRVLKHIYHDNYLDLQSCYLIYHDMNTEYTRA